MKRSLDSHLLDCALHICWIACGPCGVKPVSNHLPKIVWLNALPVGAQALARPEQLSEELDSHLLDCLLGNPSCLEPT